MIFLIYALICLCPVAVLRLLTHGVPPWLLRRLPRRRRDRVTDLSSERERFSRDLRRLAATYDELTRRGQPARALRVRAVERAYDDTLRRAGAALDLEPPAAELDAAARVQLEADLLVHGLTW
jgi:hypothetical protein